MKTTNELSAWKVLPHAPLEKLEENLWRVQGELPNNMPLKRVMTVVRLQDGTLVIYNPIALEEPAMRELEAWGTPAWLVVPNAWHKIDAQRFSERYPTAKVLAPSGGVRKVAAVVPRALGPEQWPTNSEVSIGDFEGTRGSELFMTVRSGPRVTLVVADAIFNFPHQKGVQGFMLRHVTKSSGGPCVSRVAKLLLVKDRKAFAEQLRRLATPDLARIIVAHHETITHQPREVLEKLAQAL